jgi:hypothetical protein
MGFATLLANAAACALLCAYRRGDFNMRAAWICTRNDVLGNWVCCSRPWASLRSGPVGRTSSLLEPWALLRHELAELKHPG